MLFPVVVKDFALCMVFSYLSKCPIREAGRVSASVRVRIIVGVRVAVKIWVRVPIKLRVRIRIRVTVRVRVSLGFKD